MNLTFERSYPTPLNSSPLLPLLLLSLSRQRYEPDTCTTIKEEYDYIIVGAGTAGSVVANRLSERPCVSVLLLEAGHEPPLLTEVPSLGRYFWFTDVDWQYTTTPQKHTGRSLVNRKIIWPAGKMLGGSSAMNTLRYNRDDWKIYDEWAAKGAKGWSFKDVYPYFLKRGNNKDEEFSSDGFYDFQEAKCEGERCSTAKTHLVPAENRTNLDIVINAMVTKVIIQKQQARGVELHFQEHVYKVLARKEVILSAGTVNTPQLLMLSGVGPRQRLEKLNIQVVADLPVGMNLQDHAGTFVPFLLSPKQLDLERKIADPANIRLYIRNRTGPLATGSNNLLAFVNEQVMTEDFPNYQIHFNEMPTSFVRDQIGLKPEVFRRLYGSYENKPLLSCEVSLSQPKSRGFVTLRSRRPYDSPIINPNYLQDFRDIENMVQGMKTCHRIGARNTLRRLGARPLKTMIPGCEKYTNDEDEYLTCFLRSILYTLQDPVGTAKMGNSRDKTAVVDPQLKVKNVKGLRVVDASIMPIIPSGNTMGPTIMIAEKASDMIKETIDCFSKDLSSEDEVDESSESSYEEEPGENTSKWDASEEIPWDKYNEVSEIQSHFPEEKNILNGYPELSHHNSWTSNYNHSHREYFDDFSKSNDNTYYLNDYIKDPKELAAIKRSKDISWKSYSWYKRQADLVLRELNKQYSLQKKNTYPSSNWKSSYFKLTKNMDEFMKLSDIVPKNMDELYKWNRYGTNPKKTLFQSF